MRLPGHLPLFWTICLINGVVLVVAALLLPAPPPVSRPTPCRRSSS